MWCDIGPGHGHLRLDCRYQPAPRSGVAGPCPGKLLPLSRVAPERRQIAGERRGQCLIAQEWLRAFGTAAPTAFQPRACHECRTLQTPVDAWHDFVERGPL